MTRVSYLVVVTSVLVAVTCPVHVLGGDGSGVTETQCTYNGQVINNTEDDPMLVSRDVIGCTYCFCIDDEYSGSPQALCLAVDCAPPRCVDPVSYDCCKGCPNGENCYVGRRKNRRTIPFGQDEKFYRKRSGKLWRVCRCDETFLGFGDKYKKRANCHRIRN